jgi:hypothetical protein
MKRLAILVSLAAAVVTAPAASAAPAPPLAFGRAGGNILPYRLTISPAGVVAGVGAEPAHARLTLAALTAVRAAVAAARLAEMPSLTVCPGTLPDFAGRWIRVGTRQVTVRGDCRPAFTHAYDALARAVGLTP